MTKLRSILEALAVIAFLLFAAGVDSIADLLLH